MFGFGKKKDFNTSYTTDFSNQEDPQYEPQRQPVIEQYVEPEREVSDVEKLFDKLMEMTEDSEQWTVHETGADVDGYFNYEIFHKSQPITIKFDSYENENESTIFISGENIESILGYDYASQIADQAYYIIEDHQDALEESREERNNEAAAKILSMLTE